MNIRAKYDLTKDKLSLGGLLVLRQELEIIARQKGVGVDLFFNDSEANCLVNFLSRYWLLGLN